MVSYVAGLHVHPLAPALYAPGAGWKSGFAIAPSLGWQFSAAGYGVTQIEERLQPLLAGERHVETPLPLNVRRPEGEVTMTCEPPKLRFGLFRGGAVMVLNFLGSLPAL